MYNKYIAGALGITLGVFGVHDFYLGRWWRGALQMFFFWVFVIANVESNGEMPLPIMMGIICMIPVLTGVVMMFTPKENFDRRFNKEKLIDTPASHENVADLKQEGITYFKSGDYDLAIEAFKDALEINAADPKVHFNLACCYTQQHDLIAALYHLELSVSYGLTAMDRIETHPALEWLRNQAAFETFRSNNFRQRDYNAPKVPQKALSLEPEMELMDLDSPIMALEATDELLDKLTKLAALRERGILTEREFAQRKEKLFRNS
ncbi:MAG: NINE protein [Bacteroidota bacterium]